jgi:hypothetical protein
VSTDLATRLAVIPHTGEQVDLAAIPPEGIAQILDEVKELESRLREFKGDVAAVVIPEFDRQRKWTVDAGAFKLSAPSDAPEEVFDVDALAAVLTELVDAGTITGEAMDAACEQVVEWKVRKVGINALRKSPKLAEVIDGCVSLRDPEGRKVRVSRK